MREYDKKHENIDPKEFEFVQRDEKIYDKRFETKPIGYFKDAMIRFSKNKTNVVATIILAILILFSILVPIVTSKNYSKLEDQLQFLPPRVPLLEKIGIYDGTVYYDEQLVDLETYDPETGIGYPMGFNPKFIVEGTLETYQETCNTKEEFCVGGVNILALLNEDTSGTIQSKETYSFVVANNPEITIDIDSFSGENVKLEVLLSTDTTFDTIATITEAGKETLNIYDLIEDDVDFTSRVRYVLSATSEGASVTLNSIEYSNVSDVESILHTGYSLNDSYRITSGAVSYERFDGLYTRANFTYDAYGAAFYERREKAFSSLKFDELVSQYPDVCQLPADPSDLVGWEFSEGCPVKRVLAQSDKMTGPDGRDYYSYDLVLNYQVYRDYDEIPHFLFGTDQYGRDYFALVWLGLRTSLFVGLIVAFINISIGIVYGAIEGYYGGRVDLLMERFAEIIGRIPFLVWLSLFVILLGPGLLTIIVLMTVTGWLGVAGVTRTQFYRYKGREYVLASRTLGAKDFRIIFRHILPNGIGTIITQSVLMIPGVIFLESTVSYLGYGIGHGQSFKILGFIELSGVSIGVLLSDGRTQIIDRPHLIFFPAIIISILMITFNMFGNALRDAFNPSLRGSE